MTLRDGDVDIAKEMGRVAYVADLMNGLALRSRDSLEKDEPGSWSAGYDAGNATAYEHCAEMIRRWLVSE